MEMMAPSGKFWMAMPRLSARAADRVMAVPPLRISAYTTPTAMPSGRLCSATASTSMVVFFMWQRGPSHTALFMCRWGMILSSTSRKAMPSRNPMAAGRNASLPRWSDWFMAGISRLQMEAATITPAAKPVSARRSSGFMPLRITNTQAEPSAVPMKGSASP